MVRNFVVAGVAPNGYHGQLRDALRKAEEVSGKRLKDWHGSSQSMKVRYLDECFKLEALRGRLFFRTHADIRPATFMYCTAQTLMAAADILGGDRCQVKAAHEGFTQGKRKRLEQMLTPRGRFEVRSGAFEAKPEIRLADALCGFLAAVYDLNPHKRGRGGPFEHLPLDWLVRV